MSEQKQGFAQYGLDERILQALHLLGMDVPTSIQQQVLPQVLQKRDIIAQAQTGSGKTAAFAVPLCQLVDWEENKPQVMILTPTRELAMQVQQEILDIGKLKRIKVPALYGKQSFRQQEKDLKRNLIWWWVHRAGCWIIWNGVRYSPDISNIWLLMKLMRCCIWDLLNRWRRFYRICRRTE